MFVSFRLNLLSTSTSQHPHLFTGYFQTSLCRLFWLHCILCFWTLSPFKGTPWRHTRRSLQLKDVFKGADKLMELCAFALVIYPCAQIFLGKAWVACNCPGFFFQELLLLSQVQKSQAFMWSCLTQDTTEIQLIPFMVRSSFFVTIFPTKLWPTTTTPLWHKPGECQGSSTHMLSSTQWQWLEEELTKEAAITVIVSGVQVIFVLLIVGTKQSWLEKHSHDKDMCIFRMSYNYVFCRSSNQQTWPRLRSSIVHTTHTLAGAIPFTRPLQRFWWDLVVYICTQKVWCANQPMKHFQSKIKFAQIWTKVGEDDHWLGTATESWGEVAFLKSSLLL